VWFGVQARVNDQVVGYRDLAALPRDKAILQVERPDLMTYQPHLSFSPLDRPRREVHTVHVHKHTSHVAGDSLFRKQRTETAAHGPEQFNSVLFIQ